MFKDEDIITVASILLDDVGEPSKVDLKKIKNLDDLPDMVRSAISELGHILGSQYTSALGNLLGLKLMTDPPDICLDTGKKLVSILQDELKLIKELSLVITTDIIIKEHKITGTFLFIPDLETLEDLLDELSKFY